MEGRRVNLLRVVNFLEDWGLAIALLPWIIFGWYKLGEVVASFFY